MSEPTRGLLDTSVVIDHDVIDVSLFPDESVTWIRACADSKDRGFGLTIGGIPVAMNDHFGLVANPAYR